MRFKLDENIPRAVAQALRAAGHDADTALDEALGGGSDARLMDACRRERRVLVTLDLEPVDRRLWVVERDRIRVRE